MDEGCATPPLLFVPHLPLCRCGMFEDPGEDPGQDPRTIQTTGQHRAPHVAASGLMSRIVLHVEKRSIAPRAVVLVGVPSGSWLKYR